MATETIIPAEFISFHGHRDGRDTDVQMVLDGESEPLPLHLEVENRSPTGFEWGYAGSGPCQLALAMCVEMVGPRRAQRVYHLVADRLVTTIRDNSWAITGQDLAQVIEDVESSCDTKSA